MKPLTLPVVQPGRCVHAHKKPLCYVKRRLILLLVGSLPWLQCVAQTFTTAQAGYWDEPSTWTENAVPSATNGAITINHAVTVRTAISADELSVASGLTIASNGTINISDGTGTDLTVLTGGSVQVYGQLELSNGATHSGLSSSNTIFETTGIYKHNYTTSQGVIPLATWKQSGAAGATLLISGYTTATLATSAGNWSQNFANVTWHCTNQSTEVNLDELLGSSSGGIKSIQGNLTISSTGTSILRLTKDNIPASSPYTLYIGGNFTVSGSSRFSVSSQSVNNNTKVVIKVLGDFNFTSTAVSGSQICETGVSELSVIGDFIMNAAGGTLYLSSGSGGSSSSGADLNMTGDFYLYAGSIDASVAGSDRVGEIFFNDKYITGNTYHEFYNNGTIIGTMNYFITDGHTLRTLGESGLVGSGRLRVGDTSGATLIVESTAAGGAIQAGSGSGPGNVRTSQRTYASGSVIVFGGSSSQYIGKDYPNTQGVHCQINNAAGVAISSGSGGAVTIGGKLQIINGSLTVTHNNLTISQEAQLSGGNLILNTSSFDTTPQTSTRTVTFNGAVNMTGGQVVVTSGSLDASNAILQINGDLLGTNYFSFSGSNCRVNIGGTTPLTFSRDFPVSSACLLEQLTINRSGATLTFPKALTAGNINNTVNSGLLLTNGNLRMNAPLIVTTIAQIVNGLLYFEGQSVELQRNIVSSTSGMFSSNSLSTLSITSDFAGVSNNLYFSPSGNTLGTLVINRSSNVSPHVSLNNACTIASMLYLTDGELYNTGGLAMSSGATVVRTPNSALTHASATIVGGPYHIIYNDGANLSDTTLYTGVETRGELENVTINVSGVTYDTTSMQIGETLTLNHGVFDNAEGELIMEDLSTIVRTANAEITGIAPASADGDEYNIVYTDGTNPVTNDLTSGIETTGSIGNVTLTISGTLDNTTPLLVHGSLMLNSGTFNNSFANLTMGDNGIIVRKADAVMTGEAPASEPSTGTYDLSYHNGVSVTDMATGVEANGRIYDVTVNNNGTLSLTDTLELRHVMQLTTTSTNVESNGRLKLLSTSELTDHTASIGALPDGARVLGKILAQRFMKAAGRVNRYIGTPVKQVKVSQLQDDFAVTGNFSGTSFPCSGCSNNGASLKYYYEMTPGPIANGYRNYPTSSSAQVLENGRGYVAFMWMNGDKVLDLEGEINYDSVSLPVSYFPSSGGPAADGWNLVANPFPSAISWKESGWRRTNIDPVISVPDLGSPTAYPTYYKTYNYIDGSGDDFGNMTLPGGIIASGQAFWVHVTGAGAAELTVFEDAKTSAAGGTFYRQSTSRHSEQLVIRLKNKDGADHAYLKLNTLATDGFDHLFDGHKLFNEFINVYLIDDDHRDLVMHTLREIPLEGSVSIGIKLAYPGVHSFEFPNASEFPYQDFSLVDIELQQTWPLSNGDYEFTISDPSTINDRFYLVRGNESLSSQSIAMFPNPANDQLNVYTGGTAQIFLINSAAEVISRKTITGLDRLEISSLQRGVYFVKFVIPKSPPVIRKLIKN